ncbi:hypothetical protein [Massilia luteola]|uniref:glycine-rich domain-containing protein n=1 Tax=Massilia luteola TaxID=3081751 RepID=UPI002ACBDA64|nr:hypothetical protein [Massilia sp. Gc5]
MNTNDLINAVMQLDLEPIKMKLMHVASGEGWSLEKANAVEKEYRRFLCLMKMYPEEDTAPLVDVDTFWHYHILDTMKYAADCEQAFGYFLHHYPYVGMRGEDDEQFRLDSGERMRELYEATFGEAYPAVAADSGGGARTAYCAGPDSPQANGRRDAAVATAYCAGPDNQWRIDRAAIAYCAGPDNKRLGGHSDVLGQATAYCAGPDSKLRNLLNPIRSAVIAYCAGPDSKRLGTNATAYCAGPDSKRLGADATAYCAGPDGKRLGTDATAYCAGPDGKLRGRIA